MAGGSQDPEGHGLGCRHGPEREATSSEEGGRGTAGCPERPAISQNNRRDEQALTGTTWDVAGSPGSRRATGLCPFPENDLGTFNTHRHAHTHTHTHQVTLKVMAGEPSSKPVSPNMLSWKTWVTGV